MATEKRLIDATPIIDECKECSAIECNKSVYTTWAEAEEDFMQRLLDAPIVDTVEVVHGRWKYYHKQNIAVCTNCSFERDLDVNFGKAVSCPNCGADMRERKEK